MAEVEIQRVLMSMFETPTSRAQLVQEMTARILAALSADAVVIPPV
jgi:hypothetical protein